MKTEHPISTNSTFLPCLQDFPICALSKAVEYKPNFEQVLKRYQSLWQGQMENRILARIQVREGKVQRDAFMANVPQYKRMFEDYLAYWRTMAKLNDDILPVIAPSFGTGIEGGYFGANVEYGGATSWCEHIEDLIGHPEKIKYDRESDAVNRIRECSQYYSNNNHNRCLVGPANTDCPVDILYMLRGSQIYTDIVDTPEKIKQLLSRIAEGVKQFRDEMWSLVPLYDGGTFNGWMNWWIPGRTGMVGADLFCSCSSAIYRKLGFPIHQQLAQNYGNAWFHLHTLGLHLIPLIAEMKNLICLELSEDPNVEISGLSLLNKVREIVPKQLVVKVAVRPHEFVNALETGTLPGNTIYDVCERNYQDIEYWDISYANSLMDKVRKYCAQPK